MADHPTNDDIVRVATAAYLRGESLDMSALAAEVGLARATLYRRIGNHEQLLGLVLADSTERTFRAVEAEVGGAEGPSTALAVIERFMYAVVAATALRQLVARDPVLFAKVVMAPGHVETRATCLFTELLHRCGMRFDAPVAAVAQAVVRIGDSFMYSELLGGESQLDNAVRVVGLLLDTAR